MINFWYGVKLTSLRSRLLGQVGDRGQDRAGYPTGDRRDANGVEPVLQPLHADVVDRAGERLRRRAVDEFAFEVLGFEHLAELLDAPVFDEELQPGLGPQSPIAVVTEQ